VVQLPSLRAYVDPTNKKDDGYGMLVSSVVTSAEDLRKKTATWRTAMIQKGWT
jgi:hypothetical protein